MDIGSRGQGAWPSLRKVTFRVGCGLGWPSQTRAVKILAGVGPLSFLLDKTVKETGCLSDCLWQGPGTLRSPARWEPLGLAEAQPC